ncbi:MAG: S-layer homology domain-containing protein [Oscillospiraceae bacterium]|nr:S-layer homology domain-containing protein [Oscillospiraceae bacterium]
MKKKVLAILLVIVMLLGIMPAMAMADGISVTDGVLSVAFEQCKKIGMFMEMADLYYLDASETEGASSIKFVDLTDDVIEDSTIAGMFSQTAMVSDTNIAPITADYAAPKSKIEESDNIEFYNGYSADSLGANLYGYFIIDGSEDMNMYAVIINIVPEKIPDPEAPTFTAKVGDLEISQSDAEYTENGYTYYGMVYDPENPYADNYGYIYPEMQCDLYTIVVPAGTETVDFTFSEACLPFGYDDDAYNCTEGMTEYGGGFTGTTSATRSVDRDKAGKSDFVQVQSPYDGADNSVCFYAITFKTAAEDAEISITLANGGEIINDRNGNAIVCAPVTVSDRNADGILSIDEALYAVHEAYYEGGAEAGYASSVGKLGLSLDKLWGNTSYNFGYYVNDEMAWSLADPVKEGNYLAAFITESSYPDNEGYSWFTEKELTGAAGSSVEIELKTIVGYDESWNSVAGPCEGATITINGKEQDAVTDENGKATIILPSTGELLISASKTKTVNDKSVTAIIAPVCIATSTAPSNAKVTVPSDAVLTMEMKNYQKNSDYNYRPFDPMEAVLAEDNGDGTTTYYFNMTDKKDHYYRVSGENYVTYAGYVTFSAAGGLNLVISKTQLMPEGKTASTIDHDVTSNNGFNVADVYLNINPRGYLKMNAVGDTYQLIHLRNWEAINSTTANVFVEPDYHVSVLDMDGKESDSVLSVSESGLISATGEGSAIVLVTYDAMSYAQSLAAAGTFYGAIWPENTGVFVVSVGAEDSGIDTGMTVNEGLNPEDTSAGKLAGDALDAELDIIYFIGESGEYTFTPGTEGCTVSVANPTVKETMSFSGFDTVSANSDGSFTVPLKEGRNIVKLEKDGKAEYQVISAKAVTAVINDGNPVHPGDAINIKFSTLYHPSNKLAGVYNMSAVAIYTDVDGYEGKLIGATSAQYNFASTEKCQTVAGEIIKSTTAFGVAFKVGNSLYVPADYTGDTMTLSGGTIVVSGYGDPFGNHRGITLESGKAPNLNAVMKEGYLGVLPDIEIPIVTSEAESVSIDTSAVKKTGYYAGDSLDTSKLIVTVTYADGTSAQTSDYTIEPAVLTEETTSVTITCNGESAEITGLTVNPLLVTKIAVTTQPANKTYTAGDTFDPTGMVITATYNSKATAVTYDYTYSPTVLEEGTTKVTITYTGTDTTATRTATVSGIVVKPAEDDGDEEPAEKITITVSVLGDTIHDSDTDGEVHTLKAGNLTAWVDAEEVSLDSDAYVIDALSRVLGMKGIPYTNDGGNYISAVKGLAEFSNGNNSGWMYTLNGEYPLLGVAEQKLSDGDVIVFHYTDDYTKEDFGTDFNEPVSTPTSADRRAAEEVSRAIDAIGEVSADKADEIKAAREAYNALTDTQKKLVENEDVLAAAEKKLAEILSGNNRFIDVHEDDWFAASVDYALGKGLMNGVSDTEFAPNACMTRAMLMTVLARMAGVDTSTGENWYDAGMEWAMENGISDGSNPEANITREQLVTMLWRYAGSPEAEADLSAYTDEGDVSDWARAAMQWAISVGLIKGRTETSIAPAGTATRAEVATILMRYSENTAK